ncbi:MAG: hypothetical protein NZ765_04485 [Anaerolineae bacterium]|nr:hypothetical protein [Anaerolineae bacterium]
MNASDEGRTTESARNRVVMVLLVAGAILVLMGLAALLLFSEWRSALQGVLTPTAAVPIMQALPYPPTWTPLPAPTPPPTSTRVLTAVLHPTLADFWDGRAEFVVEAADTGLPMGESDTLVMPDGTFWSYVHASYRSAGVRDRCGDPVEFPGCVILYRSTDGGYTFYHDRAPVCLFPCQGCPCDSERDHIDQQQYPRVFRDGGRFIMVYEYRARIMLRRSADGLNWSAPEELPFSGIWTEDWRRCTVPERIGMHPFVRHEYDCLFGGPPGIYIEGGWLYVFVAMGQNPGGLGCYYGAADAPAVQMRRCFYSPLFSGADEYGPLQVWGAAANPFFDFRTISAAEVQRVGWRYYALYEGIRGPGPGDPGDSQFGLGLARSVTARIDGPWEKYPGNPILHDLPGNIGLGHADLVVVEGQTLLYTSLDGVRRSRLRLVWK